MYTSVCVLPYMSPDAIYANGQAPTSSTTGQVIPYIKDATAHVVNGAEYVLVTPPQSASVQLTTGKQYRIVSAEGLNLVAVFRGQTSEGTGTTQHPMRFKVGN